MRFVLGEGLSIHLWDHGALGGCEPGAEPEPSALMGQAFLSPAGVWTKTYNQRDRAPSHSSDTHGILWWKSFKKLQETNREEHYSPLPEEAFPSKGAHPHAGRSCLSCLHLPEQRPCRLSIKDQVSAELFASRVALRLPLPFHFSYFTFSTQHRSFLRRSDFIEQHQQLPPQSHLSPLAGRSIFLNGFFSWDMRKST